MLIVEDELPQLLDDQPQVPNGMQNVPNVQPQIDLNDDIGTTTNNQNQQPESALANGMQPSTGTRPRVRQQDALKKAIGRLGRNRARRAGSEPRKTTVSFEFFAFSVISVLLFCVTALFLFEKKKNSFAAYRFVGT